MRKRSEKIRSLAGKINAEFKFKSGGLDRKLHGLHHFFPALNAQPNLPVPIPIGCRHIYTVKHRLNFSFVSHLTT